MMIKGKIPVNAISDLQIRQTVAASDLAVISPQAIIEYIGDILDQLCMLSSQTEHPDLLWLISLAREEAKGLRRQIL